LRAPKIGSADRLSLAFETNGRGCLGYIVQLPGAYVRAPTEREALAKVREEMKSYYRWLKTRPPTPVRTMIVQWHQSPLQVEDADSEILLDADRRPFRSDEFRNLLDLVRYSGETLSSSYEGAELKEWVDESKRRNTFYGPVPSTIREVIQHVNSTQHFYLTRLGVQLSNGIDDVMEARTRCVDELARLHDGGVNSSIMGSQEELWTLKKVMRRLIWHDRIHGKAIIRMMIKQKKLKLIDDFSDPFRFLRDSL
jgi:hypothetical protein